MNFQPVIQRELRVASRLPGTWRLRLGFAVGATVAVTFAMLLPEITPRDRGMVVMVSLTACAFVFSLFTGLFLTADCISREKREGTLGLLFLTPLNGSQIVLGKMATHSLQVGYALVGAFPLFFMPLLMGGVTWAEVSRVLLVLLVTFSVSLACGMLWSTIVVEARSSVVATAVSMLLLVFLPWALPFLGVLSSGRPPDFVGLAQFSPLTTVAFSFDNNFNMTAGGPLGRTSGMFIYWGSIGCGILLSIGLVTASSLLLPSRWRDQEHGAKRAAPKKRSTTAMRQLSRLAASRSHHGLTSLVDLLGWLLGRRLKEPIWSKLFRFIIVVFFGSMLLVSLMTRHWEAGFITAFCTALALHELTRLQFVLAATGPWVEDRRNGTLEALLATPVTDRELIQSHHRSLKTAFRGPWWILLGLNVALQGSVILFYDQLHMQGGAGAIFSVWFTGGALLTMSDFLTLRWLCLREALRRPTHLRAAGHAFLRLNAVAWPAFAITFAIAIQFNEEEVVATLFAMWVVFCLFLNAVNRRLTKQWLRRGLRRRISEG